MIILAIDTAGADCAAALYDAASGTLLSEATVTIGCGHAEKLMAIIDEALVRAGLELNAVGRIGVTIGPGSFTGIRVGVAAARGFALALGVEAVGISTLDVLATDHIAHRPQDSQDFQRPLLVSMDARRGEVYLQRFSADGTASGPAAVVPLDEARAVAAASGANIVGSAAALLAGNEVAADTDRFPIAVVARLAATAPSGTPKPLYLRGPDAKPQAGFAVQRM